ncbi:conserved integral membrane domain protein [Mycobacterium xenopi 3993]|nr:conserved integral membrane domain protein [Mycobacterium xenopi 3993]
MVLRCCRPTWCWWCAASAPATPGGGASVASLGRALAATVGMALGFATVFGLFGR